MESYDAYIVMYSAEESNGMETLGGSDIIKVRKAIDKITEKYNVKADLRGIKNNGGFERDMRGLRRIINSSLCSIIIVQSGNISEFMPPIIHTISKNKKLYLLVIDEKSKNVLTEITADGYESLVISDKASDPDYFKLFSGFIASAKKEMHRLCINSV